MRPTTTIQPVLSWKRNLYVIWFAQLVSVVGFSVVMPILPLYVRALGVHVEREVQLWAGIVVAAQAVTMAIFGPIWGALSDRHGRKVMVERAMFGGALLIGLMGLVQNVQQLTLLRVVQGAVTGVVTAANALVATTAPRERVGYSLGMLQMAQYVGASVGPLIGGVISDAYGYRTAFWITGALLALAGLGILFLVQEQFQPVAGTVNTQKETKADSLTVRQRAWRYLAPVLSSAPLLIVLNMRLLTRLGARLTGPILPLFVESIAPTGARVATITGLISGVSALAGAVGALWLGRLGDRLGYRKILAICAFASAACYVPQSFVSAPWMLLPLQAGTGLAMGGILASISASLARLSPEGQEGIVYGIAGSAMAIANGIGPMTGSGVAMWLGLRAPFLFAAGIFGLSGIVATRMLPRD